MPRTESPERYWRINTRLIAGGLLLGFVATFVLTFFARELTFGFLGWPFSFWVAAQGALLVYLLIVSVYAWVMNRLDERASAHNRSPDA